MNPAQLFIYSFVGLIIIGTLLLKLPISLNQPISVIDALFTATSAVCVTGLIVVDTATHFTIYGQFFIMLLIQAGGIGILSFASFFSYFFTGSSTYADQLVFKDFFSTDRLGEVWVLLRRIMIITFGIELVGALLIYITTYQYSDEGFFQQVFFSLFHAISSFCNAGFSTLSNGLMEDSVLFNYNFQFVIAVIYIFGGLGFPIVINVLKYVKHLIKRIFKLITTRERAHLPWVVTLNSRVNLITTGLITLIATAILYFKEADHVFAEHSTVGKIVIAFATATTPRTAGYNSIDFSQLQFSSTLLIIFLMWIGASPNSTGGGIKTSSFAVAFLNVTTLIRGADRVEAFRREIGTKTVQRAFATIFLSLLVIGAAVFAISYFQPELHLLDIVFECFSAYSTVGLSLGLTAQLSTASKLVLIVTMFIGRVTMLTILIALIQKMKFTHYRYASEELTIN